jgi:hypothetical protein
VDERSGHIRKESALSDKIISLLFFLHYSTVG